MTALFLLAVKIVRKAQRFRTYLLNKIYRVVQRRFRKKNEGGRICFSHNAQKRLGGFNQRSTSQKGARKSKKAKASSCTKKRTVASVPLSLIFKKSQMLTASEQT